MGDSAPRAPMQQGHTSTGMLAGQALQQCGRGDIPVSALKALHSRRRCYMLCSGSVICNPCTLIPVSPTALDGKGEERTLLKSYDSSSLAAPARAARLYRSRRRYAISSELLSCDSTCSTSGRGSQVRRADDKTWSGCRHGKQAQVNSLMPMWWFRCLKVRWHSSRSCIPAYQTGRPPAPAW